MSGKKNDGQNSQVSKQGGQVSNRAFIWRFMWDQMTQRWHILIKPVDGGQARVFADLESAFFYIAQIHGS
jgi:hypothetical protein